MAAGDYVIITFAHNDEKNGGMDGYQLKAYYEGIGDATSAAAVDLRGSIPTTTYKENLGKIVDEVVAKGAIPVICSPVCRSYFDSDGIYRIADRLDEYEIDYDVFGVSYYPYWHGGMDNLTAVLKKISADHNVKTCVMETSYKIGRAHV